MAATVYDGSLQFTSNIDDSQLTADSNDIVTNLKKIIATAEQGNTALTESNQKQQQAATAALTGINDLQAALQKIVDANTQAFNAGEITSYASQINEAAKAVIVMVAATGQAFGADKLQALDAQLQKTTDDTEELATILNFLKANVSDLKLSPEGAQLFTRQVDELSETLNKASESSKVAAGTIATSFQESTPEIDITTGGIKKLEEELDRLIEKEGLLKRALTNTSDPSAISGINKGLQDTEARITQVAERLDSLNAAKLKNDMVETTKSGANLLTQLREMRYAIAGAISQFGEGSPEVLKLTQQAAELEQRLKNASKQVSLFASNTAGLDALKQGFNGLVGGATALISAVSLLSGNNDALQETMVKLFAVMQIVNGAEQLGAVLSNSSFALNLA